jgi:phenylalanyl-tRNA synthetase alpha chain
MAAAELTAGLDPAWERGDPATLAPDQHAERLGDLAAKDPALGDAYRCWAEVLAGAPDAASLTERQALAIGRERGVITAALAQIPSLPIEQRRVWGAGLNSIKTGLEALAKARREILQDAGAADALDVTLPGTRPWVGRAHVLAQVRDELLDLFHGLGYSVYTSREVELDEYNFAKLNFAPDHPARDAHDTYFVNDDVVLRTHTSPGWIRAMEEQKPPLRLVFPGRVFRAEQVDASHMDQFHQIDGLFVDKNVSMADLKATLNTFARSIFGPKTKTRLIPIYFPFVEPGCQLDASCIVCDGSGHVTAGGVTKRCSVCGGGGWIELLGAGMVHPNVLRAVGYDPEAVTGFAFGMGLERIAMVRHGIPEIRLFLENDVRFLSQF